MAADSMSPAAGFVHELHSLRDQWWCFLVLGISLVLLGATAVGSSFVASVAVVVLFGFLLLAGGVIQVVSSFWAGKWSGMLLHLLIGLLYSIVGFMIIDAPVENTLLLTKLIAIFLIVSGAFRIAAALIQRFPDWGWVLLNGGITLLLGLLINRQWPASGTWVIGLFVGIEMIFNGWAWIMLALGLRKLGKAG
jgi:uncharacterized membrane protein HdeD (DUF308 family)